MRGRTLLTTMLACGFVPVIANGGELPSQFTLGRSVPDNVWLYIHGVHNPEREWIEKEWGEFFGSLVGSGIDRDLISLVLSAAPEGQQRADLEALIDKWMGLVREIRWSDLVAKEVVLAERFLGTMPAPQEYLFLSRGAPGSTDHNIAALSNLLNELADLSDKVSVERTKVHGADVWFLAFPSEHDGKSGFGEGGGVGVGLFRKGDVIGACFGPRLMKESVALLTGEAKGSPIVSHPRFREALGQVKPPEDLVTYFDMTRMLGSICDMMDSACKEGSPVDEDERRAIGLIHKILGEVDVVDYIVATMRTEGRREVSDELTRIESGKREKALIRAFTERKRFEKFDRYVPADATGFSLDAFMDLELVYKAAIKFIEEEVPEGKDLLAKWEELKSTIGFDPEKDLFSWFSGEMISVSLPAAVASPMGGSDWVYMLRVKDKEIATKKVNDLVDFANGLLQSQGQALLVTPADVKAEGFRQITHPMLMMFLRPVVGVTDEWLIVGSSPKSINKCLDVAAGEAPSIRQNERFQAEGIAPDEPVLSVSFKDISKFGHELAAVAGMAGMFGGMLSATIPGDGPEAAKGKQMIQKVMGIISKLGPVLQKLDFFSSKASMCTYDGKLNLRTTTVTTYRKPAEPAEQTAGHRLPSK